MISAALHADRLAFEPVVAQHADHQADGGQRRRCRSDSGCQAPALPRLRRCAGRESPGRLGARQRWCVWSATQQQCRRLARPRVAQDEIGGIDDRQAKIAVLPSTRCPIAACSAASVSPGELPLPPLHQVALHQRDGKRSREPLPAAFGDQYRQPPSGERERVVEVPCHIASRQERAAGVQPGDPRKRRGQQAALCNSRRVDLRSNRSRSARFEHTGDALLRPAAPFPGWPRNTPR